MNSTIRFVGATKTDLFEKLFPVLAVGKQIVHGGRKTITELGQNHLKAKADPLNRKEFATVLIRGSSVTLVL